MDIKLRLTKLELEAITKAFKHNFLITDHLWVFGSRAQRSKFGGDLDLYIETNVTTTKEAVTKKISFVNEIWRSLGEQKIDVVLNVLTTQVEQPIFVIAKQTGVKII